MQAQAGEDVEVQGGINDQKGAQDAKQHGTGPDRTVPGTGRAGIDITYDAAHGSGGNTCEESRQIGGMHNRDRNGDPCDDVCFTLQAGTTSSLKAIFRCPTQWRIP